MSKLKVIDKLLGKMPGRLNLIGAPMAGKTLMTLQLAIQEGKNLLIFDIDDEAQDFVDDWQPTLEKRFDKKVNIVVIPAWSELTRHPNQKEVKMKMKVLEPFGYNGVIEISSKGGKAEFIARGILKPTIDDLVKKHKIDIISFDSFSQIFKEGFTGTSSLGERSRAEDFLFNALKTFKLNNPKVKFIFNHHQTKSPITQAVDIVGGIAVLHNSKYSVFISKSGSKAFGNYARVWVYRKTNIPKRGLEAWIKYDNEGLHDVEGEELSNLMRDMSK